MVGEARTEAAGGAIARAARLVAAVALVAQAAGTQVPAAVVVRVRVVDAARLPVSGADVAVVRGLNERLIGGTTDRDGVSVVRVTTDAAALQVEVRKLGYARASSFVDATKGDTVRVAVTLNRVAQQLTAVTVTAEQSVKRNRTFVDADAISASDRNLMDALDVISKLRPNMTLEPPDIVAHNCLSAKNIWVNGKRIIYPPTNDMAEARARTAGKGSMLHSLPLATVSVLVTIKPEHIESIEYHDCMDRSIDTVGTESAIFVALKDGIGFEPGIGSHVIDNSTQRELLQRISLPRPAVVESFRLRLLGIFDVDTGLPVEGVDVLDVTTGVRARSTETGTVALAFMQPGQGRVTLSKPSYRTDSLSVTISPGDTTPITVLLKRLP